MPTYTAVGWDMYDPRMTLKGTVVSTDTLFVGACCYIDSDGYINLTDNGEDKVHGCALTAANPGTEVTLVTHGRLKVATTPANTKGALAYGQNAAGGNVPFTNTNGHIVGFCIEADLLFIHIDSESAKV